MFKILRENTFVREFELDGESIVDSKYRTCELPFRADFFVYQWGIADSALRADMVASLAEFPHTFASEASRILDFLKLIDVGLAHRAQQLMQEQCRFPDPKRLNLFVEITKDVLRRGDAAWVCVGECRWFRVLQSIAELRIDEKAEWHHTPPTKSELNSFASTLPESSFRWGVEMVSRSIK